MKDNDEVKVLITLPFREEHLNRLAKISPRLRLRQVRTWEKENVTDELWKEIEVLYTDQLLPEPEQAPALRWIQFHWAGIDHALTHPLLQKPGLLVTTLSGAGASKVAEYALALMLALGHHLPEILAYQKKSEWPEDRWKRLRPVELRDCTVGIFGYGSIGRQIARLLSAFGARILATKLDSMNPVDHGFAMPGWGDPQGDLVSRLYPPQALVWMVKECDFLIVSVPLTEATENSIGEAVFSSMKPGAFLVDVSRGGVVDHQALVQALKEQKLAGAALDVFATEPLPTDSPLWKLPNVIISPHVAGISPHYDDRAVELFAENLGRYLASQPLLNQYSADRGY